MTCYSTILSYFALNDVQDQIAQKQANSIGYRAPSYGLFKTSLAPQYWFGVPRDVKAEGLTMDVDHMTGSRVDKDNDHQRWVSFNRAQGARMSAMEYLAAEQMFSTEDTPTHGISAVKAIQLAAAEGQIVPRRPVKAFNVSVLGWLPWLDINCSNSDLI